MIATPDKMTVTYPDRDGKPMAETEEHFGAIARAFVLLCEYYSETLRVAVNSNQFVYYEEGEPRKRLAPDLFITFGVQKRPRRSYKVWVEGKYPDVVVEFTSRKTKREDTVNKFKIYETIWRVPEYFLFDPQSDYLKPSLRGYRLSGDSYVPITAVGDSLESKVLGMKLSRDDRDLVFHESVTGTRVMTNAEKKAAAFEAENARLRAQIEQLTKTPTNGHG